MKIKYSQILLKSPMWYYLNKIKNYMSPIIDTVIKTYYNVKVIRQSYYMYVWLLCLMCQCFKEDVGYNVSSVSFA